MYSIHLSFKQDAVIDAVVKEKIRDVSYQTSDLQPAVSVLNRARWTHKTPDCCFKQNPFPFIHLAHTFSRRDLQQRSYTIQALNVNALNLLV